jgi:hypothetical protein
MRWGSAMVIAIVAGCANNEASPPETCDNGVLDGDESDLDCGGDCGICALGASCFAQSDCFDASVDEARSCWVTPGGDAPECVLGFPSLAPDATFQQLRDRCNGGTYFCDSKRVLWCYNGKWWANGYCY